MKFFNWTVWFLMIDPVTHVTQRNSGPIDSDMQIDLTQLMMTLMMIALFVLHKQQLQVAVFLIQYAGASSHALQPLTHQRSHVNIRQYNCQNIHDIIAANDYDFTCISATSYYTKCTQLYSPASCPSHNKVSCTMNFQLATAHAGVRDWHEKFLH